MHIRGLSCLLGFKQYVGLFSPNTKNPKLKKENKKKKKKKQKQIQKCNKSTLQAQNYHPNIAQLNEYQ